MKHTYGFIGNTEWKKARERAGEIANKLWVERPHQGNHARGFEYSNYGDLLGEGGAYNVEVEEYVMQDDLEEIIDRLEMDEWMSDDDLSTAKELINGKMTNYYVSKDSNHFFTNDVYDVLAAIFDDLADGRGIEIYTKDEAIECIEKECSETLAVWLLNH